MGEFRRTTNADHYQCLAPLWGDIMQKLHHTLLKTGDVSFIHHWRLERMQEESTIAECGCRRQEGERRKSSKASSL
ncbi:hypothetical protein AMTR_s00023p00069170 [Amborella trichopoda]|uniref:Uncharacterized protein n=1 Tax=Amborella trichopoda TaxID=13333 RepID=W1NIF6_AMBTC|nr:hypothetical protein AMTR_s00023p00069170 [Amborella trichopoda]